MNQRLKLSKRMGLRHLVITMSVRRVPFMGEPKIEYETRVKQGFLPGSGSRTVLYDRYDTKEEAEKGHAYYMDFVRMHRQALIVGFSPNRSVQAIISPITH